jgi:hypothetical protein
METLLIILFSRTDFMISVFMLLNLKLPSSSFWFCFGWLDRTHHFHEEGGIGCHFLEHKEHFLKLLFLILLGFDLVIAIT